MTARSLPLALLLAATSFALAASDAAAQYGQYYFGQSNQRGHANMQMASSHSMDGQMYTFQQRNRGPRNYQVTWFSGHQGGGRPAGIRFCGTQGGFGSIGFNGNDGFGGIGGIGGNGGNGPGPVQPATSGLSQQLQGTWYEVSPENTRWVYQFSANSYNMFDVNPATGQVNVFDGEPEQLLNARLTFNNRVLTLSPGTDAQEGPFNIQTSPDGSQLWLQPVGGGQPRLLTRQPQI